MNLWAESDNPELASTSVDQAQKSGTVRRNSTEQAVLPALRSWLLADYVAPYCRSLAATRIFRRCFWIDAVGSTRATSKKSGTSHRREGGQGNGSMGGRGSGRDESRPYIFDTFDEAQQSNHSPSRPDKAAK